MLMRTYKWRCLCAYRLILASDNLTHGAVILKDVATHHDGVPIWARPLARVPKGLGEEMGVDGTFPCVTFYSS